MFLLRRMFWKPEFLGLVVEKLFIRNRKMELFMWQMVTIVR